MLPGITNLQHPNSLVTSGGMGTMGFGLPAGIGAKLGSPDKQGYYISWRWRFSDDNTGTWNNTAV